jgi:hypothetical protein
VLPAVIVNEPAVPEHIVVPALIVAVGCGATVTVETDEFTTAQTPLCTTALYSVVTAILLYVYGLPVYEIFDQVVPPSTDDCQLSIEPV